jgi:phenylacetate-CoA ligase
MPVATLGSQKTSPVRSTKKTLASPIHAPWSAVILNVLKVYPSLACLRVAGLFLPIENRAYAGPLAVWVLRFLENLGRWQAYGVYLKALRRCPAYGQFLQDQDIRELAGPGAWTDIPSMNKENYVKRYSIGARCHGGTLPLAGVSIDESSGSTGIPNNWVRGRRERAHSARLLRLNHRRVYPDRKKKIMVLNCLAMGPWGSGIIISSALADIRNVKSLGPDVAKLDNALKVFGTDTLYLIVGYPPFVKHFVDTTTLDLKPYTLHALVGGEGMSEGLRDYLLRFFKKVASGYGASDIEINIAGETEFTIRLRRWMRDHPDACERFFGRRSPPIIFQYNPAHYFIETNADGELLFTITRLSTLAPKIRYNLRDVGGTLRYTELEKRLSGLGLSPRDFSQRPSPYPLLWLHGRSDQTVAFYGAKIFTTDLQNVIHDDPILSAHFQSFQFKSYEDDQLHRRLAIVLERSPAADTPPPLDELRERLFNGLARVNQDFREISKVVSKNQLDVEIYEPEQGPFKMNGSRIKNKYLS